MYNQNYNPKKSSNQETFKMSQKQQVTPQGNVWNSNSQPFQMSWVQNQNINNSQVHQQPQIIAHRQNPSFQFSHTEGFGSYNNQNFQGNFIPAYTPNQHAQENYYENIPTSNQQVPSSNRRKPVKKFSEPIRPRKFLNQNYQYQNKPTYFCKFKNSDSNVSNVVNYLDGINSTDLPRNQQQCFSKNKKVEDGFDIETSSVQESTKSTTSTAQSSSASTVPQRKKYEMCKNWKEKGSCKYGDKCLFAHGSHELSKKEVIPSPKDEVSSQESDSISTLTKETPPKAENIEMKSVLSPSQHSQVKLDFCDDAIVTEKKLDEKDLVRIPSSLIYQSLGFAQDYSYSHRRLRVFQSITKQCNNEAHRNENYFEGYIQATEKFQDKNHLNRAALPSDLEVLTTNESFSSDQPNAFSLKIAKAISMPKEKNCNEFGLLNSHFKMNSCQESEDLEDDSDIWQQIENINFLAQVTSD